MCKVGNNRLLMPGLGRQACLITVNPYSFGYDMSRFRQSFGSGIEDPDARTA